MPNAYKSNEDCKLAHIQLQSKHRNKDKIIYKSLKKVTRNYWSKVGKSAAKTNASKKKTIKRV